MVVKFEFNRLLKSRKLIKIITEHFATFFRYKSLSLAYPIERESTLPPTDRDVPSTQSGVSIPGAGGA